MDKLFADDEQMLESVLGLLMDWHTAVKIKGSRFKTFISYVWWDKANQQSPAKRDDLEFDGILNRECPGVQTPARAEIWFEISAPSALPSQLIYDEYTDCTLSVGRWDEEGDDRPPAIICRG